MNNRLFYVLVLVLVSGCSDVATTAVTGFGYSIAQERSLGNAIDDATIGTKINSYYLTGREGGKLFKQVAVEVIESRVLLTGSVDTADDRVEAVRLAWQAKGVKEVLNEIQIDDKSTIRSYAQDVWLSAQVKTKLLLAQNIKSINYTVDTVNGTVYIMGITRDKKELDEVNRIASVVKGVEKVVSHVVVKR